MKTSLVFKNFLNIIGIEKNIAIYLVANDNAIGFYEKIGMKKSQDVMEYSHINWTPFTIE